MVDICVMESPVDIISHHCHHFNQDIDLHDQHQHNQLQQQQQQGQQQVKQQGVSQSRLIKSEKDKELLSLLASTTPSYPSLSGSRHASHYLHEVRMISDHLSTMVQRSEQVLYDKHFTANDSDNNNSGSSKKRLIVPKEPSEQLMHHVLSIMKKLDYYLAEKSDMYGDDIGIGYMALLCGLVFIERLPEGTLTRNNIYPGIGVAMGLGIKALFDEHPLNDKLAYIFGVESLKKYNGIELRFCNLVKYNFFVNEDIINNTKKRFARTTNACAA